MNASRLIVSLVAGWWFGQFAVFAPSAAGEDGLLRRQGKFVNLTTDLPSEAEAQRLVDSFDAAVPQWIRFWNLAEDDFVQFRVEACVMRDKTRFEHAGLIPQQVPDFPFGYALGQQIWVKAQESEYYTRHLMLHEGVHCFAFAAFGGAGPTWFQEGTAELLATHRGSGRDVVTNHIPRDREEVPYWGRFKLMSQLREEGKLPSLLAVMQYQPDLKGDVAVYGWSWAAAMILHAYPEYQPALLAAAANGPTVGPGFNRELQQWLRELWPVLAARWRVMCHDLDYGFDWSRERVALSVRDPLWDGRELRVPVAADRGWQSVGVRLPPGVRLHIQASGEVTLASTTRPWISQPDGITLQYHRGRPLGQLMVCMLPNAMDLEAETIEPLAIEAVGDQAVLDIDQYCWLLFRVNDDVGKLGDNRGAYEVVISRSFGSVR